jgi:hypothetical protein
MGKTENINKRKREKEANWASNSHFGPTPLLHRAAQLATAPRADRWASLVSCSRNHSSLTFSLDLGPARSAISFVRVFAWVPRSPFPPPPPCGLLVGPTPPGRRLRELGGPCRTPCAPSSSERPGIHHANLAVCCSLSLRSGHCYPVIYMPNPGTDCYPLARP